ncbi:hypothetical protein [Vibrio sp. 14G-20]|uniref:hypothetical protein n=2 Tax=unclassified Vibrio TaxID=2614977 RepID=UPI00224A7ABD|nr:hypothetical protein [Vibrio sp. 14G-20]
MMKKLILAAMISSMTFGANAAWTHINFDNLSKVSKNEIKLQGKVPKRCLLRVGKNFAVSDVLQNARQTALNITNQSVNNAVTVGHLRAWCNYGDNLDVKVTKKDFKGVGNHNGSETIAYAVNIGSVGSLTQGQTMDTFTLGSTSAHLANAVSRHEVQVTPEDAGFARAGTYKGKIKFRLTAQ